MARWVSLYAINTASLSFLLTLEACLSHIGKKDRLLQLLVWSPNLFDFIHLRSGSVLFVCPLLIKTSIYQRAAGKKKGPLSVWAFEMGHELAKMAGPRVLSLRLVKTLIIFTSLQQPKLQLMFRVWLPSSAKKALEVTQDWHLSACVLSYAPMHKTEVSPHV